MSEPLLADRKVIIRASIPGYEQSYVGEFDSWNSWARVLEIISYWNALPLRRLQMTIEGQAVVETDMIGRSIANEVSVDLMFRPIALHTISATIVSITIKTLTDKTIPITISLSATALHLKEMVSAREGIPSDQQRLIVAGYQMDDRRPLSDYAIETGTNIHMVLMLSGS